MANTKPRDFELLNGNLPDSWELYSQPVSGNEQKALVTQLYSTLEAKGFARNPGVISVANGDSFQLAAGDWLAGIAVRTTTSQVISIGLAPGGTDFVDNENISAGTLNSFPINEGFISAATLHVTLGGAAVDFLIKKI